VIVIAGSGDHALDTSALSDLEREIVRQKQQSRTVYRYDSEAALMFELRMRSATVQASRALNASRPGFTSFQHSRCNERYWNRTEEGGFRLRSGVTPAEGLRDIFQNGREYAFECATAIVIVFYRAILDTSGEAFFNTYFPNLYLYDWHHDSDLRLIRASGPESFPGDVLYFPNPDHDPRRPEWQGENAVKLADNLYYGHGIGIASAEAIIAALNRTRAPGSTVSAYMSDLIVFPDTEHLRRLMSREPAQGRRIDADSPIVTRIGSRRYIC